jgi:hypothetical protein
MKTLDEAYAGALAQMQDPSVHGVKILFTLNGKLMAAEVNREVMAADLPQIYNIRKATMIYGLGSEYNGPPALYDVEVKTQAKVFCTEPEQTYDFLVEPNGTIRVWDSSAMHYTLRHCLSDSDSQRIRYLAKSKQRS